MAELSKGLGAPIYTANIYSAEHPFKPQTKVRWLDPNIREQERFPAAFNLKPTS